MGLFSFLNRKNESGNAAISMLPVINPVEQAEEEVSSVMTTTEPESSENKPLTVSYATGWPIDIIYGYLHKNYEEKGFGDSMIKSDLTFRDMNMNIIKNKILMVFREINLNYDVMKRDIETRMDTCSAAGLISTVSELENQMSIITTHKQELEQLEREFKADDQASVPLQSARLSARQAVPYVQTGYASSQRSLRVYRRGRPYVGQASVMLKQWYIRRQPRPSASNSRHRA